MNNDRWGYQKFKGCLIGRRMPAYAAHMLHIRCTTVAPPPPPPTIPPLRWPPHPNTASIFNSRKCFFLVYMTPFTAVFQYHRYFASPESGGIGGRLYYWSPWSINNPLSRYSGGFLFTRLIKVCCSDFSDMNKYKDVEVIIIKTEFSFSDFF